MLRNDNDNVSQIILIPTDKIRPKSGPPSTTPSTDELTSKQIEYKKIATGVFSGFIFPHINVLGFIDIKTKIKNLELGNQYESFYFM